MVKWRLLILTSTAALCLVPAARSQVVTLPETKLSTDVQAKLEEIACMRPYKVRAKHVSGYSLPAGRLSAWVTCEPHAERLGHQVFGEAECDNHRRTWGCKGWLKVVFATEGYPSAVRLDDVPIEDAIGMVEYLGRVPIDQFAKLWLLERHGVDRFTARTSGNFYELTRHNGDAVTYEITGSGLVDY
jgi:hypothetical protein